MSLAHFSRWTGLGSQSKKMYMSENVSQTSVNSHTSLESTAPANEIGTLVVVVMKAKNLHNRRAISKQNPYCSVRIAKQSDRTKAITRGGQQPFWDHETRFKLSGDDDNTQLKLCVFDQNGSNTEIIGDATIPLSPAFNSTPKEGYDSWFPIHYNKRYVGEVYLEMTFYPKRAFRSSRQSSTASSICSPSHSTSISMRNSESMPALPVTPKRSGRPLPQVPKDVQDISSQEDISRLINDGYEASLLEKLKP